MAVLKVFRRVFRKFFPKKYLDWKKIEYFNTDWKSRIEIMSQFIKSGDSVLDLGCGEMWLKEFMPKDCVYIPVDYRKRKEDTVVCDFNKNEFPEMKVEVGFISGCFEYIVDYNLFVGKLRKYCDRVIISYVSTEIQSNLRKRKNNAWRNHLDKNQFLKVFVRNGFNLDKTVSDGQYVVYHFQKYS